MKTLPEIGGEVEIVERSEAVIMSNISMVIHKYARILLSNFWHQLWFYDENRELTCHEKTLDDRKLSVKNLARILALPHSPFGLCKAPGTIGLGPKSKMELPPVESHQSEVPKPNPAQRASNAESLGHLEGTESKGNFETAQSEAAV